MEKVTLLQMTRGQRPFRNVGLWALNPVQFFSSGPFWTSGKSTTIEQGQHGSSHTYTHTSLKVSVRNAVHSHYRCSRAHTHKLRAECNPLLPPRWTSCLNWTGQLETAQEASGTFLWQQYLHDARTSFISWVGECASKIKMAKWGETCLGCGNKTWMRGALDWRERRQRSSSLLRSCCCWGRVGSLPGTWPSCWMCTGGRQTQREKKHTKSFRF